jgi:hypothetical protein
MSINKLISIKNPIVNAIMMRGLDHNKDMPFLMTKAIEAEKMIGSRFQYERKICVLDICGCAACLPDDAAYVERAIMGNQGTDCANLFNSCFGSGTVYADQANGDLSGFLIVDISAVGSGNIPYGIVSYEIQNNKILFMNNYDGQQVTVQYMGVVTDCDGFPMISENHVPAIEMYLNYVSAMRKKNKSGAEFNEMQFFFKEWIRLRGGAIADDNILTEPDRMAITAAMSNPYAGRGLWMGMRNENGYNDYFI